MSGIMWLTIPLFGEGIAHFSIDCLAKPGTVCCRPIVTNLACSWRIVPDSKFDLKCWVARFSLKLCSPFDLYRSSKIKCDTTIRKIDVISYTWPTFITTFILIIAITLLEINQSTYIHAYHGTSVFGLMGSIASSRWIRVVYQMSLTRVQSEPRHMEDNLCVPRIQ